jgi:hypothetical protein
LRQFPVELWNFPVSESALRTAENWMKLAQWKTYKDIIISIICNDQGVIAEIREEIKHFLEANENQNTTYQNVWNTAKTVIRGKFIAMNAYIKRTERSQIN